MKGKHRLRSKSDGKHEKFKSKKRNRLLSIFIILIIITFFIPTAAINAQKFSTMNSVESNEEINVKSKGQEESISIPVTIRDYKADGFFFEPEGVFSWVEEEGKRAIWIRKNFFSDQYSGSTSDLSEEGKPIFDNEWVIGNIANELMRQKSEKWGNGDLDPSGYHKNSEKIASNNNYYNGERKLTADIFDIAFNKINSLGDYSDAKSWYERTKNRTYQEIEDSNEINTAYRYVYYYLNNLFNDLHYITSDNNPYSHFGDNKTINNKKITLNLSDNGSYVYDSSISGEEGPTKKGYFPINGEGFGNEMNYYLNENESENNVHYIGNLNYHFTMEGKTKFILGDEVPTFEFNGQTRRGWFFSFSGDDDVWIYLNGKKVIDLSGIHGAEDSYFMITPDTSDSNKLIVTTAAGYENGENPSVYDISRNGVNEFSFFYMERHTGESNLKIETNIKFKNIDFIKTPYVIENDEEKELTSNSVVNEGDSIFYKFNIKNITNNDIEDIVLVDEKLNLKIDKKGIYDLNGNKYEDADIQVIKNGIGTDLSGLSELKIGESLEIKSNNIFTTIDISDDEKNIAQIQNTAKIQWEISEIDLREEAEASCDVVVQVRKINYDFNVSKEVYKINDNFVDNSKPLALVPEDKVQFKIVVKNNSKIEGTDTSASITHLSIYDKLYTLDSGNSEMNIKDNWNFTYIDSEGNSGTLNQDDFGIAAGGYIDIYAQWQVSVNDANAILNNINNEAINKVTILHPKLGDRSAEVAINIRPASLIIEKNVVNIENDNKKFTITTTGYDNSKYVIEAIEGIEYKLDNLKYQEYEITEIVPMNYVLNSITIENKVLNDGKINLDGTNNNLKIILQNEKVNENYFYDESNIENKFNFAPKLN